METFFLIEMVLHYNNADLLLSLFSSIDNMDLLDEKVLKKHRPDLIEYMKVSNVF